MEALVRRTLFLEKVTKFILGIAFQKQSGGGETGEGTLSSTVVLLICRFWQLGEVEEREEKKERDFIDFLVAENYTPLPTPPYCYIRC